MMTNIYAVLAQSLSGLGIIGNHTESRWGLAQSLKSHSKQIFISLVDQLGIERKSNLTAGAKAFIGFGNGFRNVWKNKN